MSHLHDILNPESTRKHAEILSVVTEFVDTESSDEDDTPAASDDEVDELDDESGEEEDYDEPPTVPVLRPVADLPVAPAQPVPPQNGSRLDVQQDREISRDEEKPKPKAPAPRRRLEKHDKKIDLGLHDHKAHADCPDTLACLPDTPGRPQHTLPVILRCAILGSPRKRLTIREIYATMESKYPYYKSAGQTWKQSVRHHLSLNRLFERQPRPVTDPGFGSYWTVNLSAPPGTKRPRKRGRPNKDAVDGLNSSRRLKPGEDSPTHPGPVKFQFQPQTHPAPPPPPLPLPQVNTLSTSPLVLQAQVLPQQQPIPHPQALSQPPPPQYLQPRIISPSGQIMITHNPPPPPPHHHIQPMYHHPQQSLAQPVHAPYQASSNYFHHASPHYVHDTRTYLHPAPTDFPNHRHPSTPVTSISGRDSTYPPSSKGSDTEDSPMRDDTNDPTISDDDFESEEEMDHASGRRETQVESFVPTNPSSIFSLPPFSALEQTKEDIMENMRQEIATLRRTSAEAVSTSLRLTEQLANANLEVSRSREAIRSLEDVLQAESHKRKEVERTRDQEIDRRRAAEHALSSIAARSPTHPRPT